MNSLKRFVTRSSAPSNLQQLINNDLKRYCSNMVLKSFIVDKFELNPTTLDDSCKALLVNSKSTIKIVDKYLATNNDIFNFSIRMLNTQELLILMHYAIYTISKQSDCIDPIQVDDNGCYALNEAIAKDNREKLKGKNKIIEKIYTAENILKNSDAIISFTDDEYGSNIYSALLRHSLINV